jgi:hypothetical protein
MPCETLAWLCGGPVRHRRTQRPGKVVLGLDAMIVVQPFFFAGIARQPVIIEKPGGRGAAFRTQQH